MPGISPVTGLPGLRARQSATHGIIFRQGTPYFLAGGKLIDGAASRDPGNTPIWVLRPGLLMGKITATGLYAPSIIGVITGAYTSGGTTLTVTAAQAAEIARRVGSSGTATLNAIGPPTANGTLATTAVTYSAVNTTTGVITVTSLGVNKVAGTLLTAADGSQTPITMIPDGYGTKVVDDALLSVTVPFEEVPIAGVILSSLLLPVWPSDTSIQAWIRTSLSTASAGKFIFDDQY